MGPLSPIHRVAYQTPAEHFQTPGPDRAPAVSRVGQGRPRHPSDVLGDPSEHQRQQTHSRSQVPPSSFSAPVEPTRGTQFRSPESATAAQDRGIQVGQVERGYDGGRSLNLAQRPDPVPVGQSTSVPYRPLGFRSTGFVVTY